MNKIPFIYFSIFHMIYGYAGWHLNVSLISGTNNGCGLLKTGW